MKNIRAKLMLLGTILLALVVIVGDCRERRNEAMSPNPPSTDLKKNAGIGSETEPKGESLKKPLRSELHSFSEQVYGYHQKRQTSVPLGTTTQESVWEDEVADSGNLWMMVGSAYENRHWF